MSNEAYIEFLTGQTSNVDVTANAVYVAGMRNYYDGIHKTRVPDRLAEIVGISADGEFNVNFCPMVVNAYPERLVITGFDGIDEQLAQVIQKWQRHGRFRLRQKQSFTSAGRDGASYLIPEWDEARNVPRISVNAAYDGFDGIIPIYDPETDELITAIKLWNVPDYAALDGKPYGRMNVYYDNRVEKWQTNPQAKGSNSGQELGYWVPLKGMETRPIEWRGGSYDAAIEDLLDASGAPLGIPVFPLRNHDDGSRFPVSDLDNLVIVQELINKTISDLQDQADKTAAEIILTTAHIPTLSGETKVKLEAGDIIQNLPDDFRVETIGGGASLSNMVNYLETLIGLFARLSNLPMSKFTVTRAVQAEGTLKQQESGFLANAEHKQDAFGYAWETALTYSLKLGSTFGAIPASIEAIDDMDIAAIWAELSPRSDEESLRVSKDKKEIGIPEAQLWAELGYSPQDISDFEQKRKLDRNKMLGDMAKRALGIDDDETQAPSSADADNSADNGTIAATSRNAS